MTRLRALNDAMSDVLGLIRMQAESVALIKLRDRFGLRIDEPGGHFYIVEHGRARLQSGRRRPLELRAGDLAILPTSRPHVLSNGGRVTPIPIRLYLKESGSLEAKTSILWGQFSFAGVLAPKLLASLPPLIHVQGRTGAAQEWLKITSGFLVDETRFPKPGSAIMVSRLMELLFIQSIRDWGAGSRKNMGWLAGVADPCVGRALSALHERPAEQWTVAALAKHVGLSRSAFASRFNERVGVSPLRYLSLWRLNLAAEALRAGTANLSAIAALVGYGSEAALSRAFKAAFGATPSRYRRAPVVTA